MLYQVGEAQSVDAVSDNKVNRFNGTGIGVYATSNGKQSTIKHHTNGLNIRKNNCKFNSPSHNFRDFFSI